MNPFGDMNSNNNDGYSERERLEIDNDGKKLGQKKQEKREEQMNNYSSNSRGRSRGFGKGGGFRGGSGGGGSSFLAILVALAIIGGLIYIPISAKNGTLPKPLRSFLNMDAQANADKFLNDVQKFKKETDKKFEHMGDPDYEEKVKPHFYDVNPLFNGDYITNQVDMEYFVFVYTGDKELDQPFIDWIETYEAENPKNAYKIYRISLDLALDNPEIESALTNEDYSLDLVPLLTIHHTPVKNQKTLDSVIKDSKHLEKVIPYMDKLMEESNDNR